MVTSTELGYLSGVTSNIQDQLNGKALSSHDHYRDILRPAYINLNETTTNTGIIIAEAETAGILDIFANNGIRVWNSDKTMLWIDSNPNSKYTWVYKLRLEQDNYGTTLPSNDGSLIYGHIFFLKSN